MATSQEISQMAREHARRAQESSDPYTICFYSQQAAEKYLKAFLVSKGQVEPLTHEIPELITQCVALDPDFAQFKQLADVLSLFDVEIRHEPSQDEATKNCPSIWQATLKISEFVRGKTSA